MELNKFKYPESDANVVEDFYREIWHENEYDRYFKINHGDKVIDCGAFIGMFSLYARQQGASQIVAIEADKERYECLKQNCSNAPVTPINKCVKKMLFKRPSLRHCRHRRQHRVICRLRRRKSMAFSWSCGFKNQPHF